MPLFLLPILSIINLKPTLMFFQLFIEMAKQFYACNWVPSRVTEVQLEGCVATSALARKEVIHWRVPGPENPPEPKDGEVVDTSPSYLLFQTLLALFWTLTCMI